MKTILLKCVLLSTVILIFLTTELYAQGNFVYTNNGGTVSGFKTAINGSLSEIAGSPFQTGEPGRVFGKDIKVSQSGNLLFVSNDNTTTGPTISVFSINSNTGFLTPVAGSPFQSGTGPVDGLLFGLTPGGKFLFAANVSSGKVAVFSIASDGALTAVTGSPFSASNVGINSIEVSPDGRFLFVAFRFSNHIAVLSIAANGSLSHVSGSPFSTGTDREISSIDLNCTGNLLFAASLSSEIAVFNIGSNGSLSHVSGSPFSVDSGGFGNQTILHNQRNNMLYVTNDGAAQISIFEVSPTGGLSFGPLSSFFMGDENNEDRRPRDAEFNQAGTLLYVLSADDTILDFDIAARGSLILVNGSPFTVGQGSASMLAAAPPNNCSAAPNFDLRIQDDGNRREIDNRKAGEICLTGLFSEHSTFDECYAAIRL
jgi:6-phosphogluconolactonase